MIFLVMTIASLILAADMVANVALAGVVAPYNVGVSRMWYRRHLKLPSSWQNLHNASRTLLHFGGVDWECEVWLNKVAFPVHQGGCAVRPLKRSPSET